MDIKKFKVTDQCIGCMACVGIAESVFQMDDEGKAVVVKQPDSLDEQKLAVEAMEACPVEAIIEIEAKPEQKDIITPITADLKVKDVLDKYPELKQVLMQLSPKFKRLQNPVSYNTLAKFVSFSDAAKITGVSLCEILHSINRYLGVEDKLQKIMPDCIKVKTEKIEYSSEPITWSEPPERYVMNFDNQEQILDLLRTLKPQKSLVVITTIEPDVLVKYAHSLGFKYNIETGREYRISFFNPAEPTQDDAIDIQILDLRNSEEPLNEVLQTAKRIKNGGGFAIIQHFVPEPLIKMVEELGFESKVEKQSNGLVKVYFYKKIDAKESVHNMAGKPKIVLQSATPVAYPVIMALLESARLRKYIDIEQIKVWKETEKHLGWIVNRKADISFSAVITSSKLRDLDVVFPAVVVWDNFTLLTRGYEAKNFGDVKDKEIYLPLFADAPPAKITKYLIKASGYAPEDFKFRFGNPFGRPEIIFQDLAKGKIDTAVLREPEASFAIKILEDQQIKYSELRFDKIWNEINPGFGDFPNAGVVIKGEFARKYPDLVEIFLEELRKAVDFVKHNKQKTAQLSYQMLRQPEDRVLRFLERVHFKYLDGRALRDKIKHYFTLLNEAEILNVKLDEKYLGMFG